MKKRVLAIIMAVVISLMMITVFAEEGITIPGYTCWNCNSPNVYFGEDSAVYTIIDDENHHFEIEYVGVCQQPKCFKFNFYPKSGDEPHTLVEKWDGDHYHSGNMHYYKLSNACAFCTYSVPKPGSNAQGYIGYPCRGNGNSCAIPFSNPIIHEHVTE